MAATDPSSHPQEAPKARVPSCPSTLASQTSASPDPGAEHLGVRLTWSGGLSAPARKRGDAWQPCGEARRLTRWAGGGHRSGKPEHASSPSTCPQVPGPVVLPSMFGSIRSFLSVPTATALAHLFSLDDFNSLLRVSLPPSRLQPVQPAHTGRGMFFNIANLSMRKTLQCLPVTFRTKSQLQAQPPGRAIPAGLSNPIPLRSNCAKLLVTLTRSPAPGTVLSICFLNNNNCIHNSCHLLNIYFLSGAFIEEEAKAQRC